MNILIFISVIGKKAKTPKVVKEKGISSPVLDPTPSKKTPNSAKKSKVDTPTKVKSPTRMATPREEKTPAKSAKIAKIATPDKVATPT